MSSGSESEDSAYGLYDGEKNEKKSRNNRNNCPRSVEIVLLQFCLPSVPRGAVAGIEFFTNSCEI